MNNPRTYHIGSGARLGPERKLRFHRFNEPNDYGVEHDEVIVSSSYPFLASASEFIEVARIDLTRGMVFGPDNPHGHTPKGVRVEDLRVIDEYLEDLRKEDDDG